MNSPDAAVAAPSERAERQLAPRERSAPSGARQRIPFIGAFESTYLPNHGVDVAELNGHDALWNRDVTAVRAAGVDQVRYALRWHRIEREQGHYDWSQPDAELETLRDNGLAPIVDLVHHTSYPDWITDGFRDRRFGPAYVRYARAVAERYPWLGAYTLFNEPFATLFLSGHEALWPPYDRGLEGFVRLATTVMPAISAAAECFAELLPRAEHTWIDTCEHHAGTMGTPSGYSAMANDRRHALLDLALHYDLDETRPFLGAFLRAGGDSLLELPRMRVDVIGLDYYNHSEWWYELDGAHSPSPFPIGFAAVAQQYWDRYRLPMMLSETNLRGLPSDRASWLKYTLEQYEHALDSGVDLRGYCWFPYVDSCDWDSLLARAGGRVDPVGVVGVGRGRDRERTVFTDAWERAARGADSASLPAYEFQAPCDAQLSSLYPSLEHWDWQPPPDEARIPATVIHLRAPEGSRSL